LILVACALLGATHRINVVEPLEYCILQVVIIEQSRWRDGRWDPREPGDLPLAQVAFVFADSSLFGDPGPIARLRRAYPEALLVGCSTAGEICGPEVTDGSLVCTAVRFDSTVVRRTAVSITEARDSLDAGRRLADQLEKRDLAHVFVLSDGQRVNGSQLVKGMSGRLPAGVTVTGGLAGDGTRFERTLVLSDNAPEEGAIVALGFYGPSLRVGFGSLGGWDPFGPDRLITRSRDNVLFELDGQPALDLYKKYLGDAAAGLPAAGLLFPLSLRGSEHDPGIVRTILSIDEQKGSLVFAGDTPEGTYARFMKANFDRLVDGAAGAARSCVEPLGSTAPDLAVLISCVGRKLVLKQRVDEEVEGVRDVLGDRAVLCGFYSYGEISPVAPTGRCELHNQTMTITTFSERAGAQAAEAPVE
jgi:hypothetical protein